MQSHGMGISRPWKLQISGAVVGCTGTAGRVDQPRRRQKRAAEVISRSRVVLARLRTERVDITARRRSGAASAIARRPLRRELGSGLDPHRIEHLAEFRLVGNVRIRVERDAQ